MALAITDDHRTLAEVARAFLADQNARTAARERLDGGEESAPPYWKQLCELGWLGLHLPEEYGGQGYGVPELAVVLEELAREVVPGPFLPTVLASGVIAAAGSPELCREVLPGLADGSQPAALGLGGVLAKDAAGTYSGD